MPIPTQNPWNTDDKPKMSFDQQFTKVIQELCSPSGVRKLGLLVFGTACLMNLGFWVSVTTDKSLPEAILELFLSPTVNLFAQISLATLISGGSTLFQLYPIAQGGRSMFSELLATAFRPQTKHLPGAIQYDKNRVEEYDNSPANFNKMMKGARVWAIALEVGGGIIKIGSVMGGGVSALISLGMFLYSIVGAEIGFSMARQADEVALSAEGKAALEAIERKSMAEAAAMIR